jgi:hypothetical protein
LSARPVRRRRAALSAALDARRIFTRSRCKLRAISAGLMLSSTTHQALDLLPTLNARNWRGTRSEPLGPFRLTKALLGALAASVRVGSGSVVINISSDAAVSPMPGGVLTAPARRRSAT